MLDADWKKKLSEVKVGRDKEPEKRHEPFIKKKNNDSYKYNGAKNNKIYGQNNYNSNITQKNTTEPYNFVPFSNFVLESPLSRMVQDCKTITDKQNKFADYLSENETYSGHFTIDISNVTPMLINMNNRFFTTGNGLCIPGSSVRGLVKNIFKIVASCGWRYDGNNGDFEERKLYFRSLYARKDQYQELVEHYKGKMLTQDKKRAIKTMPGFLVRDAENHYYVIPAEFVKLPKVDKQDWTRLTGQRSSDNKNMLVYVGIDPNYETPMNVDNKKHTAPPGIKWHDEYVDVFSGGIDGKKRIYRINKPDIKNPLKVDLGFIENYKADNARNGITLINAEQDKEKALFERGFVIKNGKIKYDAKAYEHYGKWTYVVHKGFLTDKLQPLGRMGDVSKATVENNLSGLIAKVLSFYEKDKVCPEGIPSFIKELALKYEYIVPCFYVFDGQIVTSFGAGPYYRINYTRSIADHLPSHMNNESTDTIDYADAIFGFKEVWASRVFFEDLYVKVDSKNVEMLQPDYIKILEKPRPTSFQNYLTSDGKRACHWDEPDAMLRGYKMYWHHKADWIDKSAARGDKVNLLKEHATFTGKVRFENLTKTELGALSKVFHLGKENDIHFKIGMGKPLGLGSIKIDSTLYVQPKDYYNHLFGSKGFVVPEKTDFKDFINAFDKVHSAAMADEAIRKSYDESYDALKEILYYPEERSNENSDWHGKFMYTDKSESPTRKPLLPIKDVVKRKK